LELVASLPPSETVEDGYGYKIPFRNLFMALTRGFLDLSERLAMGVPPGLAFAADYAFKEELSMASNADVLCLLRSPRLLTLIQRPSRRS
jgi:hypothetical protein